MNTQNGAWQWTERGVEMSGELNQCNHNMPWEEMHVFVAGMKESDHDILSSAAHDAPGVPV